MQSLEPQLTPFQKFNLIKLCDYHKIVDVKYKKKAPNDQYSTYEVWNFMNADKYSPFKVLRHNENDSLHFWFPA